MRKHHVLGAAEPASFFFSGRQRGSVAGLAASGRDEAVCVLAVSAVRSESRAWCSSCTGLGLALGLASAVQWETCAGSRHGARVNAKG